MTFNQLNMLIALGREYGHARIRDSGVSDTAHRICTFLCFHGEVSQDTVAGALMLDKTTVAKALGAMERKELISRTPDPSNRRRNILRITDAGKETISASVGIYDTWFQSILSCLTAEEQRQLDSMVQKLVNSARVIREQQPKKCSK